MKKAIQTTLFYNPSKKEKKEFVNNCMELFNTFRRPKIVMPGYESMPIPEKVKSSILIERLLLSKAGEKLATETEALWYISTASLVAPFSHHWHYVFLYLFRRFCIRNKMELPEFVEQQIVLEEYTEERELYNLRKWIYDKGMKSLK